MYGNYREFWADYRSVANYYQQFNDALNWVAPLDPERAWNIYQQARHQRYGVLVMGRTCVDEPSRRPADFGNAITVEDHQALGVITHNDEAANVLNGNSGIANMNAANGGMIMHFYSAQNSAWRQARSGYHFLYNDAWLLGGAHGTRDFNLASPRRRTNPWERPTPDRDRS